MNHKGISCNYKQMKLITAIAREASTVTFTVLFSRKKYQLKPLRNSLPVCQVICQYHVLGSSLRPSFARLEVG